MILVYFALTSLSILYTHPLSDLILLIVSVSPESSTYHFHMFCIRQRHIWALGVDYCLEVVSITFGTIGICWYLLRYVIVNAIIGSGKQGLGVFTLISRG